MNTTYTLRQAIDVIEDFKRYAYREIHLVNIRWIDNIPDWDIEANGLVVDAFDETEIDPCYKNRIDCYLNTNAILTRFEAGVTDLTINRPESRMEIYERTSVYLEAWMALIQLSYPKHLVPSDDLATINSFLDWISPTIDENRINRENLSNRNKLAVMLGGKAQDDRTINTYVPINRKQQSSQAKRQIARSATENMFSKLNS